MSCPKDIENNDCVKHYYFEKQKQSNQQFGVTPITDAFVKNYPGVVDRFFIRYYSMIEHEGETVPYQVLFHSNRICLICLPPEHPACIQGIQSLTFNVGNTDRSTNTVKGKGKKGGMILQANSTLAVVKSIMGKTFKIPSCISGKLVEVNVDLVQTPERLQILAEGEAYLAIVLPKPDQCDHIKSKLLTESEFKEIMAKK